MSTEPTAAAFHPHTAVPWQPAPGYEHPGADQKVLLAQPDGAHVRLVRWPAGFVTGATPLRHPDFDEFAWVVAGTSINLSTGFEATPATFCAVPAGLDHGPFRTPDGVLLLEVRLPIRDQSHADPLGSP